MKLAYFLIALFLVVAFSIANAQSLKTAEEYDEGKRYILKVGQDLGLKFA